ncbi:MAG: hypothetical protein SPK75_09790 [Victivallales bacterium]|nr:hypothetical protein [bacterium]MDY5696654.1 hypothetical protein [Victivallales bacterium]
MKKQILKSLFTVCAVMLMLSASAGQPREVLRLNITSLTGFLNSASTFAAKIAPEIAGTVMMGSAAIAMNPQFAAVDISRPVTVTVFSGAKDPTDAEPFDMDDLFYAAAVSLRPNAVMQDKSLAMLRLPDGRAVLYQPNPLYNKMLEKQAANLFPEYRGLIPFQMRIDADSILQHPLVKASFTMAIADAITRNPSLDAEQLEKEYDNALRQFGEILFNVNFPDANTLDLSASVAVKPGSELAKQFGGRKTETSFAGYSVLPDATILALLDLPVDEKMKQTALSTLSAGSEADFSTVCARHLTGKAVFSYNGNTGAFKFFAGILPGTAKKLRAALTGEKIRKAGNDIYLIEAQTPDADHTYVKVFDDAVAFVVPKADKVRAAKMLDDTTRCPQGLRNGQNLATFFKKDVKGAFVPTGSLKFDKDRFLLGVRLSPEDFPKQDAPRQQIPMK